MRLLLAALFATLCLSACLKDHPVFGPGDAYDPRLALRNDSLGRFDSLEVLLVDADDTTRTLHQWTGQSMAADTMGAHVGGSGQPMLLILRGYRADGGLCFYERIDLQEGTRVLGPDTCGKIPVVINPPIDSPPEPRFQFHDLDFGDTLSAQTLNLGATGGSYVVRFILSDTTLLRCDPDTIGIRGDTTVPVHVSILRKDLAAGPHRAVLFLQVGGHVLDSVIVSLSVNPRPVPEVRFQFHDIELKDTSGTEIDFGVTGGPVVAKAVPSAPWLDCDRDTIRVDKDTTFRLGVGVNHDLMPIGPSRGYIYLKVAGRTVDSITVTADVPRPVRRIWGIVRDWRDSVPQPGMIVTLDGINPGVLTGADGSFAFEDVANDGHSLAVTGTGRIGTSKDVYVLKGEDLQVSLFVAPAAAFTVSNIDWSKPLAGVSIADGFALVPSTDFDEAGEVVTFPLDNPNPALHRFLPQGNAFGDSGNLEYGEAGESVANEAALFIAYPDASRLGRIGDWKSGGVVKNAPIPFQPSGLLLDGDRLLALGRISTGLLVLGEFNAADLSLVRLDSLAGFTWDGLVATQRGPKLIRFGESYYAVDGNGPNVKGKVIEILRSTRKVVAWVESPDGGLNDLSACENRIYVASQSSGKKMIRVYAPNLAPIDSIITGTNTNRIRFATEGNMAGYGFVSAEDNSVLVIRAGIRQVLGTLKLLGSKPGLSIAVDGPGARVLISDGAKIHSAAF